VRADKHFLAGQSIPSRRHYPRVETPSGVWVYWNCKGREDTSRVRDLSMGGLFVETEKARDVAARRSGLTFLFRKDKSGPKLLSGM
jgi:hypothetical protein